MNKKNRDNLAYLLLTLAALFWSGNFVIGKTASFYEIPPFSLNFYRWLFVWIILFPFTFKEIYQNTNKGKLVFLNFFITFVMMAVISGILIYILNYRNKV